MVIGYLISCFILFDEAIAYGELTSFALEDSGRSRTKKYTRRATFALNERIADYSTFRGVCGGDSSPALQISGSKFQSSNSNIRELELTK